MTKQNAVKKTTKSAAAKKSNIWLSPSAWGVWRKCALSVESSPTTLKAESDAYAYIGTRAHEAIAWELNGGEVKFEDSEDAAIVRFAVDTTKSIIDGNAFYVEQQLLTLVDGVTIGGTADCLVVDGDTIIVIDHKTGWREVEAEGNEQLKIYAHLATSKWKAFTKWRGVIINARFNSTAHTETYDIDPNYLKSLAKDIKDRQAKKQKATGHHCAYCNRLSICAPIRTEIKKWLAPGAIDCLTRNPETLAECLRLAKPAEKLFETVKKEAQLYIDLGGSIPGISVEYTAGNRAFPRDLTKEQIAEKVSLPVDQLIETSLVTPTEALRRGADKDAVNAIVIRPPRKGFKFS